MKAASRLVALLLGFCAVHGVSPDTPNTWAAWKTFKSFARATAEVPDPGVSVQLIAGSDDPDRLVLLRQELRGNHEWLSPIGGVVWELKLDTAEPTTEQEIELWSFDYHSFDAFVDAVEQHDVLSRLLMREASSGRVYWEYNDERYA